MKSRIIDNMNADLEFKLIESEKGKASMLFLFSVSFYAISWY
jgi:hypothetical protein